MTFVFEDIANGWIPSEDAGVGLTDENDKLISHNNESTSISLDLGSLVDRERSIGSDGVLDTEKCAIRIRSCNSFCYARSAGAVETSGELCIVKCMAIDETEGRPLERLLEVLDRLVDTRLLDSPRAVYEPVEESTTGNTGNVFLQEIYDIFCGDEKVHVIHSFHERSLKEPLIAAWFLLPSLSLSSSNSATVSHLDSDGASRLRQERTRQDVLHSLRLLAAELILGLLFLHNRGIVHLNISPENIMVTFSGHIQVGNFGSANVLPKLLPGPDLSNVGSAPARTSLDSGSSVTPSMAPVSEFGGQVESDDGEADVFGSVVLGSQDVLETTKYSAPEMQGYDKHGRLLFDEKADWWSLGAVMLELGYREASFDQMTFNWQREEEDFKDFLVQLTRDPAERLFGVETQKHKFLDVASIIWPNILDLRHPPCPALSLISVQHVPGTEGISSLSVNLVHAPIVSKTGSNTTKKMSASILPTSDSTWEGLFVDDSESDTQPFPSSASLYQDFRARYIQDEAAAASLSIKLSSQQIIDSRLGLIESVSSFVDTILEEDEEELKDSESSIRIRVPSRREVDSICDALPFSPDHSGEEEEWADMTVDEMVALSLLQARGNDGQHLCSQNPVIAKAQQKGIGIGRRVRKARRFWKASRRAMKLVPGIILAVVSCW